MLPRLHLELIAATDLLEAPNYSMIYTRPVQYQYEQACKNSWCSLVRTKGTNWYCYEQSVGVEECQCTQDEISNNVASWLLPKHAGELLCVYYSLTDVLAFRSFCGSNIYLESWCRSDPSSILESLGTSFAIGKVRLNRMESSTTAFMSFDQLKTRTRVFRGSTV
jgi:hypothetical protein